MSEPNKVNHLQIVDVQSQNQQNSSQTIYKIQLNSKSFPENDDRIGMRSSKISNSQEQVPIRKLEKTNSDSSDKSILKSQRSSLTKPTSQNSVNTASISSSKSIKSQAKQQLLEKIQNKLKSHNYKNFKIEMKQNGDCLVIMEQGKKLLVRAVQNIEEKPQIPPGWERQNRIGCCCFSMSKQHFCFSCCMISSLCICIQTNNICCFCDEMDCSYCCVADCCRQCCFQKTYSECCLLCCKSLPCCSLYDCLVNGKQCNCNCLNTAQKVCIVCCEYFGKICCAVAICMCICVK